MSLGRRVATAPAVRPRALRVCPICDRPTADRICAEDGTATLSIDAPHSDPDRLQAGTIIAERYRIEALIGAGGFAKVFSAMHTGTGQSVALKVLGGGGFDDDTGLRRFFREARASAALKHPNTVRVFDFGQEEDGTVYLAMELLCGRTLRAEQDRRRAEGRTFTEAEAIRVGLAIAQSLAEAHCLGLVHRDIGPTNVFLHEVAGSEPSIKVLDFGLVKDGGKPLTRARQLFGTVAFMSPEQALGRNVGPKSDLYSLGILLWWMLTGVPPFSAADPREVMRHHVSSPLPPLRELSPSPISASFEELMLRATAKDPEDRFEDAPALRRALEGCLEEAKFREADASTIYDGELPRSRWPRIAIGLGAIALGLAVALPLVRAPRSEKIYRPVEVSAVGSGPVDPVVPSFVEKTVSLPQVAPKDPPPKAKRKIKPRAKAPPSILKQRI